jgi:tRNA (mo5U34)-methyltransferase
VSASARGLSSRANSLAMVAPMLGSAPPAPTRSVEDVALWYHTLALPGNKVTPGWFDLRRVVDALPWPSVAGMRCLDVGTYDGFYAFELERRGAQAVVATDIRDHRDWDFPARARAAAPDTLTALAGEKGLGFEVAREALSSRVEKRIINVYDLSPETVGMFDVVVCGSLLLHLRDPVRALEAIRSVCRSWFMSIETVSLRLGMRSPRHPLAEMRFDEDTCQWWVPNVAGHRRMVEAAGFEVTSAGQPFSVPFGVGHTPRGRSPHALARQLFRRALTGGGGVPHAALLARPQ